MTASMSTLHAMAGRFLTGTELLSWESSSQQRCLDLVRAFQTKVIDPAGLQAALSGERMAIPAPKSALATVVLELTGVLMPTESIFSLLGFGTAVRTFMQQLMAASADSSVKAIVVVVDSPGGSIRMIPEAAALVRAVRARKPIAVSVAGMNASAAYWLTSGATVIAATPSASLGSIGIITERTALTRLFDREGVDIHVLSAGKFKSEGHPALPMNDGERAALQSRLDEAYTAFVNDVALGRHALPAAIRTGYGEGRLVSAVDAVRFGMIDQITLVEETIARAATAPMELTTALTARVDQLARAQAAQKEIATYRQRAVLRQRGRRVTSARIGVRFDTLETRQRPDREP